jgi:hypothetical protein
MTVFGELERSAEEAVVETTHLRGGCRTRRLAVHIRIATAPPTFPVYVTKRRKKHE